MAVGRGHVLASCMVVMNLVPALAFTAAAPFRPCRSHAQQPRARPAAVSPEISLAAGMLAGAVGKGVAYPLDTIKTKQQTYAARSGTSNPFSVAAVVLKEEGVQAFYSGVSSTMVGEAFIKGAVFFTYDLVNVLLGTDSMILAAAIAGAVATLVATPVERIKCVMQANGSSYASPWAWCSW